MLRGARQSDVSLPAVLTGVPDRSDGDTMTGKATPSDAAPDESRRAWIASLVVPGTTSNVRVGRLVLTGSAAKVKRTSVEDARAILTTAIRALADADVRVDLLVTPAGFLDVKEGPGWPGSQGWRTSAADFAVLADRARAAVPALATPEILGLAAGHVARLVLGIDIWPTQRRRPYGETACVVVVPSGTILRVTGKSFPNSEQQGHLIREPNLEGHLLEIPGERVAILVCHDLAAWHPRGIAARRGRRAIEGGAFNDAIEHARPTIALHLPHTLEKVRTWAPAWGEFARRSGGELRAGTSAVRYRTLGGSHTPAASLDGRILAGIGWGERVVDIVVHDPGAWPDAASRRSGH